tara:strand:+ start:1108 stop:1365 length:258 start_codon:yes stop_codon:yes gene_type:complete
MESGLGDIMSEKRIRPNKFTELGRLNGQEKARKVRRKDSFNDGLTSQKRRELAIIKAANGCWWIESYLRASINWRGKTADQGIDD